MHKRWIAAEPATVLRCAHSYTPPRGAILSGIVPAAALAEIIDQIMPHPDGLAARIREPAQAFHVRAVIVAGIAAELAQIPAPALR
jgi:hypothetical protein